MRHSMTVNSVTASTIHLEDVKFTDQDTYISYLPYSHIFEQFLFGIVCVYGMRVGYYGGDILKIVSDDLPILKPTFFPAVPRLFNRLYSVLQAKLGSAPPQAQEAIQNALKEKLANLEATGEVTHKIYDAAVFANIRMALGGNVKKMLTGSAPLSKEVMNFFKVGFSLQFIEAFGMTETTGGSVLTMPGDNMTGHVGGPVCNVKLRLKDIPEAGYLHTQTPARGEICFWGTGIMKGYFRNPEKTKEALTHDGWMQSGDVGIIHENG